MTTLAVDPAQYTSAASDLTTVAQSVSRALGSLSGGLGASSGMAGTDDAGTDWAAGYDSAARAAVDAGSSAVSAAGNVATRLHVTGANYAHAEAASTIGRGDAPVPAAPAAPFATCPNVPSASGGSGGDEPFGWSLVSGLIGYLWPNGHQDRLHAADAAWKAAAAQLTSAGSPTGSAAGKISGQQAPESPAASKACTDVGSHVRDLAAAFSEIGDSCSEYAAHLDQAHHEILSELKSLLAQTVAVEAVSALVGIFTAGIGELAGQAIEAGRLAAAAAKIRTIIEALIAAARTAAAAVGRVASRAGELLAKLEPLATGAVKTGATAVAKVAKPAATYLAKNAKPAAVAVAKAAPKNFAAGAGMEAAKEGVVTLGTGENHFDPTKVVSQGAFSTIISPVGQKVANSVPLEGVITNKVARTAAGLGIKTSTNATINTSQQAVHEAVSPDTADDVSGTSILGAAKAAPDAIKNAPSVLDSALDKAKATLSEQNIVNPEPSQTHIASSPPSVASSPNDTNHP